MSNHFLHSILFQLYPFLHPPLPQKMGGRTHTTAVGGVTEGVGSEGLTEQRRNIKPNTKVTTLHHPSPLGALKRDITILFRPQRKVACHLYVQCLSNRYLEINTAEA